MPDLTGRVLSAKRQREIRRMKIAVVVKLSLLLLAWGIGVHLLTAWVRSL